MEVLFTFSFDLLSLLVAYVELYFVELGIDTLKIALVVLALQAVLS